MKYLFLKAKTEKYSTFRKLFQKNTPTGAAFGDFARPPAGSQNSKNIFKKCLKNISKKKFG